MKKKTIGLTIQICDEKFSVWSSGARMNIFYLAETLMLAGYNVIITDVPGVKDFPVTDRMGWDTKKYVVKPILEVVDELDMLILIGSEVQPLIARYLKDRGCKVVYYLVGTRYIMDMQDMIFKGGKHSRQHEDCIDEFWLIPQMVNTCHHYIETLYKRPVKHVPFLWGTEFLELSTKGMPNNGRYRPGTLPKRAACFEPNLDVVKFCMYDLLIAEKVYCKRPDLLKMMYVTNSRQLRENPMFVSLVSKLRLIKEKAASFDSRYSVSYILSHFTDVVVAHQWENALNYAYLDALYLGYPLVHNAHIIKDGGYYYEGFDAEQGSEQMIYALEHHDSHLEEYRVRNEAVLDRYRNTNPANIEAYRKLVDDLLAVPVTLPAVPTPKPTLSMFRAAPPPPVVVEAAGAPVGGLPAVASSVSSASSVASVAAPQS